IVLVHAANGSRRDRPRGSAFVRGLAHQAGLRRMAPIGAPCRARMADASPIDATVATEQQKTPALPGC
ncbi:MAG: hypothetical protein ACOYPS_11475, partial [Phycisphaerales bacterium]